MKYLSFLMLMFALAFYVGCASQTATTSEAEPHCSECAAAEKASCPKCAAGEKCDECADHCAECADGKKCEECAAKKVDAASDPHEGKAVIDALGMSCPLCASSVDRRMKKLYNVEGVGIDLGKGHILVSFKDGQAMPTPQQLAEAVTWAGFTPTKVTMPDGTETELK